MHRCVCSVLVLVVLCLGAHGLTNDDVIDKLNATKQILEAMNETIRSMQRQLVLNQLYIDEKVRSDGDSGIKQIRGVRDGTRPYFSDSHTGNGVAAIHDHSDNIRTVGMGEIIAVMNGIDFRTRHNDYRLYMPDTNNKDLHAFVDVPYPGVPPEVTNKATVEEQMVEMREWFKAWQNQNKNTRDYTKYFKPVLAYLEGGWLYSTSEIDEAFSDRHAINADTYGELMQKIMYASYTGSKENNENLAFLPLYYWNTTEEGEPIYAQWNYRIMTHPIKMELNLNRLRVVDDLKGRMVNKKTLEDWNLDKAARFSLNVQDNNNFVDKQAFQRLQEELMNEIPGKDNYGSYCEDWGMDGLAKDPFNSSLTLNACYYHRRYQVSRDASGFSARNRGFADQNLYMAITTQDRVVPMDNVRCITGESECANPAEREQKWSYAIPMEVVWMTPLNTWNPYNITFWEGDDYNKVTEGGRDGSEEKPYYGSNSQNYYWTPTEFFSDFEPDQDPADTAPAGTVYVLDQKNVTKRVRASGTRILFPEIEGVGVTRQRYPIMPVHGEGSGVWKELEALQDLALSPITHAHMYYEEFASGGSDSGSGSGDIEYVMAMSVSSSVSQHTHSFLLSEEQRAQLASNQPVTVETTQGASHTHQLVLYLDKSACNDDEYAYSKCDGADACWDGHGICNAPGS